VLKLYFVLGGEDAEMVLIKHLLSLAGVRWVQPARAYHEVAPVTPEQVGVVERKGWLGNIEHSLHGESVRVVFVETKPADGAWLRMPEAIDHHGDLSHLSPAILQVLALVERETGFTVSSETRRWAELVGANDAGYIPAMLAIGATSEEIARVRQADRSAQGITPAMEREAERAIAEADDAVATAQRGELVVVRMAHSKTNTVADRLFEHWSTGRENLLVLSGDGEANFFGDGALCAALKERFTGWAGGAGLGKQGSNGYWGGYPPHEEVLVFIRKHQ
jgi:hypothetical protein